MAYSINNITNINTSNRFEKTGGFYINGARIDIQKGQSLRSIAARINNASYRTGVTAKITGNGELSLKSKNNKEIKIRDKFGVLFNTDTKNHPHRREYKLSDEFKVGSNVTYLRNGMPIKAQVENAHVLNEQSKPVERPPLSENVNKPEEKPNHLMRLKGRGAYEVCKIKDILKNKNDILETKMPVIPEEAESDDHENIHTPQKNKIKEFTSPEVMRAMGGSHLYQMMVSTLLTTEAQNKTVLRQANPDVANNVGRKRSDSDKEETKVSKPTVARYKIKSPVPNAPTPRNTPAKGLSSYVRYKNLSKEQQKQTQMLNHIKSELREIINKAGSRSKYGVYIQQDGSIKLPNRPKDLCDLYDELVPNDK